MAWGESLGRSLGGNIRQAGRYLNKKKYSALPIPLPYTGGYEYFDKIGTNLVDGSSGFGSGLVEGLTNTSPTTAEQRQQGGAGGVGASSGDSSGTGVQDPQPVVNTPPPPPQQRQASEQDSIPQKNFIEYEGQRIPVGGTEDFTGLGGEQRSPGASGFNVIPSSEMQGLLGGQRTRPATQQYTYEQTVPGGPYRRVPVNTGQALGGTPSNLYGPGDPRSTIDASEGYLKGIERRNQLKAFNDSIDNLSPGRAAVERRQFRAGLQNEDQAVAGRQANALQDMFQRQSDEPQNAANITQKQGESQPGGQMTEKEKAELELEQRKQRFSELKYSDKRFGLGQTDEEPLTPNQLSNIGFKFQAILSDPDRFGALNSLQQAETIARLSTVKGVNPTINDLFKITGFRDWYQSYSNPEQTLGAEAPRTAEYLRPLRDPQALLSEFIKSTR